MQRENGILSYKYFDDAKKSEVEFDAHPFRRVIH